jgi:antitoxin component of RelBE/YafQ-DinJ toxin-antitoxin module
MEKTETVLVRVNKQLKQDFKRKCESKNTTESQKVRDLITEWIKK